MVSKEEEDIVAEEVSCECGSLLSAFETVTTSYSFRVRKHTDGESYIEFGKRRTLDPMGDTEFECTNPECNNLYSMEEVYEMVREVS